MRVLQLFHKPPYPAIDGGCLAEKNMSDMLLMQDVELKTWSLHTTKHPFLPQQFPKEYLDKTHFESHFIDTSVSALKAFIFLFRTNQSYNLRRFYSDKAAHSLKVLLEQEGFDVILFESIYVAEYLPVIRSVSDAKMVLRAHNVEHQIWERLANEEQQPLKKWYYYHLHKRLKNKEVQWLKQMDQVITISQRDALAFKHFLPNKSYKTIPFTVNITQYPFKEHQPKSNVRLFHIGAMDWMPNVEGVRWFIKHVWSQLKMENSELELHLAGKSLDETDYDHKQLMVHGEVPNAVEFMLNNDIMIVPLFSGSGMRIKIIEAMALGKVVVSTGIGLEGIDGENGIHFYEANTPSEFISVISQLTVNRGEMAEIGQNARQLIENKYNQQISSQHLLALLQQSS